MDILGKVLPLCEVATCEYTRVKGEPIDGFGVVVLTIARRYVNYQKSCWQCVY
jgi:hypothetical protein